jgi:phage N-6-adenine-methyltransferase
MNPALLISKSVEYETPQQLFDDLDREFHFCVDVCATHENHKCEPYFTIDSDGLKQDWTQWPIAWMNPPYGNEISKWMQKAYSTAQRGTTVVCLVPARTDTAWWHDYCMKGEIRFIRGRIRFQGMKNNAPFPSAIVIFKGIPA